MAQQLATGRRAQLTIRLAVVSLGLAGVGIAATAANASAHVPDVSASCTGGLNIGLTQYEGPATNNHVTVTIDGDTQVIPFGGSLSRHYPWDSSVDHTWSVVIDANLHTGNPTRYDTSFHGTQLHCTSGSSTSTTAPRSTTTAPEVTTTTAPRSTTTAPEVTTTTAPRSTTTAPEVTTTTAPRSTTTTAPVITTTTAPGSTTTSVASESPVPPTSPTTTAVASEAPVPVAPTTTAVASEAPVPIAPTTTVAVASEAPLPPSAVVVAAPVGNSLPATGSDTGIQLGAALVVVLSGFGLISISRRRHIAADRAS